MSSRILIVEDEPEIAELIEFHLSKEGLDCDITHTGRRVFESVRKNPPDLVVLDRMLPDTDGMDICRKMKAEPETRDVPIIMVTARGEDVDVISGIELGAEDYVVKPFSPKVLVARILNILRRNNTDDEESNQDEKVSALNNRLHIDSNRHRVTMDGQPIDLTLTEFSLLRYLAVRPGFVRSRDNIIANVHGRSTVLSSRTVDVHVTALRRKLGEFGSSIETVRGVGYRFTDQTEAATHD